MILTPDFDGSGTLPQQPVAGRARGREPRAESMAESLVRHRIVCVHVWHSLLGWAREALARVVHRCVCVLYIPERAKT